MSGKRFTIYKESKYKEEWYAYPFCIKEDGEVVLETIPLRIAEKVRDKLNEQQDFIYQLQDLCGESDSENAKLRIENKELQEEIKLLKPVNIEQYEQIVQLQEENEQLRRLFEEMKQPITINLTEEDEKELRKLLGLIDDE